jgi:hypothetical protein
LRDNATRHRVALIDLALWYLEKSHSLSTNTRKPVGRPWGKRSVEA